MSDFALRHGYLPHPPVPGEYALPTTLESNLARVRAEITAAARAAGRDPAQIELLPVTKSVPAALAAGLRALGQRDLGESRADELERKVRWFEEHGIDARWHFVGHLQRNKARRVVELADVIHSVDSLHLIETLDRIAADVGRSPQVYLQVKLHPEDTKAGFEPALLCDALGAARAARHLVPVGLMTMAPLVEDDEAERVRLARHVFLELARLAHVHAPAGSRPLALSMGMSGDFALAIQAGSTCVRVGSALFEGVTSGEVGR